MIKVYIDSGSNIPAVLVKQYDINVISFINSVNGEPLVCFNPDLTPQQERELGKKYYDAIREGAEVKTSLISEGRFEETFEKELQDGNDIIYFSISSNISGNFNSSRLVAVDLQERYPDRKIYVVDSKNASLATGFLAMYTRMLIQKNVALDDIYRMMQEAVGAVNGVFTVGNLKYLAHTGRINSSVATIGDAISLKAILRGNKDGYIVQHKICRGRKKALKQLLEYVTDNIVNAEKQFVGIAHADAYPETLEMMAKIKEATGCKEVIDTSYDFCTGSHVGPETIALFWLGYDRELEGRPDNYKELELFKYL